MIQTLADALAEKGYETLTPVQQAVTESETEGRDLLVSAQTGSGKTVGFGLAIAPTLLEEDGTFGRAAAPLALIVAPTRELAFQVMRELQWLYAKAGARVASCVGGMDMRDERRTLDRGAHIVVGTPGRLVDHIKRGSLDMTALRAVVLDEADEMLDLGFREDLEFMLDKAPAERRTLLFSATVPPMIAKLAKQFQNDALRIQTISEKGQHADISYQALRVAQHDSEHAIINLLRYHDAPNAIVFANTRAAVNRLMARFSNRGFSVVALSGELSQAERSHALQAMRDGRARVCVATDVAARGIDLPGLELVIHAELPSNEEGLLHRSGRTGRAGRKGISALIVPPKMVKKAERLLKFAKVQAEWGVPPSADDIHAKDEERLLADPVWSEEITPDMSVFAGKLLELHSPEVVAAAYLRLYQSRQSAPEELTAPDARPERREARDRAPFGPSRWIALSVGHDDRAEPRWLLPLVCRTGGVDKDSIGAIRIQQGESFVELAEGAVEGFMKALGPNGEMEKDVSARLVEGEPDFVPSRGGPRGGPKGGPRGGPKGGPRGDRGDRPDRGPRPDRGERPNSRPHPRGPKPAHHGENAAPDHGADPRPRRDGERVAPAPKPKRASESDGAHTGYKPKPAAAAGDRPARAKPVWGKGDGAKSDKPRSDKPRSDKPKYEKRDGGGKPAGKPFGKPGGKPAGKGAPKAGAKSPAAKAKAADTSKRFTPPGKSKSPASRGGNDVPRRGKGRG